MGKAGRLVILTIAAGFAVAIGILATRVFTDLERIRHAPDDNLQWAVFQLQNEFNRAYRAILVYDPANRASVDELKLSYDILYSRIDLVQSAPTFAGVRDSASLRGPLGETENAIKAIAPKIDAAPAGVSREELLDGLAPIEPVIKQITVDALHFFASAADRRRDDLTVLVYTTASILGLTLAAAIAGIAVLFGQKRQIARNEHRLRESERDLARAQAIAQIGSFRWNVVTNAFRASEQLHRIYGVGKDEVFDRERHLAAIHPRDRDRVLAAFAMTLQGQAGPSGVAGSDIEYAIVWPDGSVRRVRDAADIEFDAAGNPTSVVGTVRDITVESDQREALSESERRLRMAQRLARVGSYAWDMVSGEVTWSDEVYRIYGVPPGTPITIETLPDRIHPDDRARMAARMRAAVEEPDSLGMEILEHRLLRPDGSVRVAETASEIERDGDGRPIRMIGTVRDITEEREHESALEAARDEAERANRSKGEFLAVMSHEVRTPMNGVLGMLSALEETGLDDRQKKLCDVARTSAEALLVILNDILDASKIEAGKLELEPAPFELRPLLRSIVHLYGPLARAKGVALDSTIADGTPGWLVGDAGRLRQMMLNFASNAVKFTSAGSIMVAARTVGEPKDGTAMLRVEVSDTGPGIPEDRQAEVFARFNQLDRSFARRFGGTGLGLAITKSLAELMGGRVGLSSRPGEGSVFWLEVPLAIAKGETAAERAPSATAPQGAPLKILVAEDNATNQLVARMLLESLGHRVDVANDGLEAVEAARARHYDLILMDVSMPGLDGIEATRQIRAVPGEQGAVPIFALTANAMDADRESCLEAGMQRVLVKPLNKVALAAAVATVAAMRTRDDPRAAALLSGAFDGGTVNQLIVDLGEPAFRTLIGAFRDDLRKRRAEAEAAARSGSAEGLRAAMHSLRGAASIVGAESLRRAAAELDDTIRAGQPVAPDAAWSKVAPLVDAALAAIERVAGPVDSAAASPA